MYGIEYQSYLKNMIEEQKTSIQPNLNVSVLLITIAIFNQFTNIGPVALRLMLFVVGLSFFMVGLRAKAMIGLLENELNVIKKQSNEYRKRVRRYEMSVDESLREEWERNKG